MIISSRPSLPLSLPPKIEIAGVLHYLHNVRLEEMAILTPYSAQKDEIRKLAVMAKLQKEEGRVGIKVASITESQGKTLLYNVESM